MAGMDMLNIGCGTIYHADWINIDIVSDDPAVMSVDITKGLPFVSNSFTACYSSHVLEHMPRSAADDLLQECFRVLRSEGVLRLVVPDLETIVRDYLEILEKLKRGDRSRASDYEWMLLEMYDQVVRNQPGGDMAKFLADLPPNQRSYVSTRIGGEAKRIWEQHTIKSERSTRSMSKHAWLERLKRLRLKLAKMSVCLLAGRFAAKSFERGVFRDGGEIHQWMYDSYSLRKLLERHGFIDIRVCRADQSRIPDFVTYELDTEHDQVRKPDSLFMEAIKP
jgi:SAM-dependent methyltransferase